MTLLRELAAKLFKTETVPTARLSHLIGVRQRQVQYWVSGAEETPEDVLRTLHEQIHHVERHGLAERIERLIQEAKWSQVDPVVIGHFLDLARKRLEEGENPVTVIRKSEGSR